MAEYEGRAQQAIQEFDAPKGLELRAEAHLAGPNGDDFLEIIGRIRLDDGVHAFSYRATRSDLDDFGDTWFTKQALTNLDDMFRANRLPAVDEGAEAESQYLKPLAR